MVKRANTYPKKLTLLLPSPLKRELDNAVHRDGRTLSEFCRTALSMAIRENRQAAVTAK